MVMIQPKKYVIFCQQISRLVRAVCQITISIVFISFHIFSNIKNKIKAKILIYKDINNSINKHIQLIEITKANLFNKQNKKKNVMK